MGAEALSESSERTSLRRGLISNSGFIPLVSVGIKSGNTPKPRETNATPVVFPAFQVDFDSGYSTSASWVREAMSSFENTLRR
jgi:hypothetical protein